MACPKCGKEIVLKKTKKGRKYYGCEDNPDCDFMSWQKPSKEKCPKCGGIMVGRRLQLQERIGQDIADIMAEITGSEDVAVVLEGYHSCVSARGIKKNNTRTMTVELRGSFKDDAALQMYLR